MGPRDISFPLTEPHHKGDTVVIHKRSKMFFWEEKGYKVLSHPSLWELCWSCRESLCSELPGRDRSCSREQSHGQGCWQAPCSVRWILESNRETHGSANSPSQPLLCSCSQLLLSTPSHPQLFSTKPEPMSPQKQGEPRELWLISLW